MIKSVLSNWMTLVVSAACSILLTPFLVHKLGLAQFGMWTLTGAVIDYYGLLDMGMRAGLFRFAARYKGVESRRDLDETFASALSAALCAGAAVLVSLPPILWLLPKFLRLDPSLVPMFRWTLLFMGFAIVCLLAGRMLSTYVASLGRFDYSNLADTTSLLLRTGLTFAVLEMHRGIVAVGFAYLSGSFFYCLFSAANVRRVDPRLGFSLAKATWRRIRELTSFSIYASVASLGDYLRFYTDSVVITRMLAVTLVMPFSIPGKLLVYMQALIVGFGAPVNAEFNSLDAQNRQGDLRRLFLRATRMAAVLTLLMVLLFAFDGKSMLDLWIRQDMSLSYKVLLILLCGYAVELSQHPNSLIMLTCGRQKELGWLTLLEGSVNLGLSIWWAKPLGILGVALGTAVPMVFFKCLVYPLIAVRLARISLRSYVYRGLARPFAAAGLTALVVLAVRTHLPAANTWGTLLLELAWQGCAAVLLFAWIGMNHDDRSYARVKLSAVFRRVAYSTGS